MRRFLFLFFCFFVSYPLMAQEGVVKQVDNKVVIEGKQYYLHTVREKETLFSICKLYEVSMEEVMRINGMKVTVVNIDQILRIPVFIDERPASPQILKKEDADYIYHLVRQGETLFSLSQRYNVGLDQMVKANPETKRSLAIGSTIRIPKSAIIDKRVFPPKDERFYFHEVKPGDTEFAIARKYSIKLRKLRKINTDLKKEGLRIGSWIRIPKELVSETQKELVSPTERIYKLESVEKDTLPAIEVVKSSSLEKIRLALLLPIYLDANDTINQIRSFEDTLELVREREQRIIYPRSHDFIRFYQGVLMAVDTLRKKGVSVDLHVFDTERSEDRVRHILTNPEMKQMDIIIGPVYSNSFTVAADFAKQNRIPIVSPLSAKNSVIETNPYVFQLNTSISSLCSRISDYVTHNCENQNLVVIYPDNYQSLNEYELITDLEQKLFYCGALWQNSRGLYKKISFDEYGLYGIAGTLSDSCENIVLIPSTNQPVVDNIVTNLNVLSGRYNIRLMGFPVWQRFDSMDPENLFSLNMSILGPYYINYQDSLVENFVNSFREEFQAEPTDFSFRAYDLCLYFSEALSLFGKNFYNHLDSVKVNLLQGHYKFERAGSFGGFENRGLHLVRYNSDYLIHHSIPSWMKSSQSESVDFLQP